MKDYADTGQKVFPDWMDKFRRYTKLVAGSIALGAGLTTLGMGLYWKSEQPKNVDLEILIRESLPKIEDLTQPITFRQLCIDQLNKNRIMYSEKGCNEFERKMRLIYDTETVGPGDVSMPDIPFDPYGSR